jgi:hypothetical protein
MIDDFKKVITGFSVYTNERTGEPEWRHNENAGKHTRLDFN